MFRIEHSGGEIADEGSLSLLRGKAYAAWQLGDSDSNGLSRSQHYQQFPGPL